MIKNILIISSDYTGHGHKSITESLSEFFCLHEDVNIHVVDGFSLGGNILKKIGKLYGPITRNATEVWKLIWDISCSKPALINKIVGSLIKEEFLRLIEDKRPDLILSVHPNFNGSVLDIMEEFNINIPFVTLIADLISISPLWADSRADYTISPTSEAKDKCIEFGVPEEKVKVLGFPVRSRFCNTTKEVKNNAGLNSPFKCLIMSGGEGVGNMKRIAEILLDNYNCVVKIVAGRNIALQNSLKKSLESKYGERVHILGFTKDIQDLMLDSDIAITRGSPNVMMEAVACNIPLVITGALPGQEEGNPAFAEKYKLAVSCSDINEIKTIVDDLTANNAEKLCQIKNCQISYYDRHIAENIVDFILNMDKGSNYQVQRFAKYKVINELQAVD